MKMHHRHDHINRLHDLVKRKATGSLDTRAQKFGVGRSSHVSFILMNSSKNLIHHSPIIERDTPIILLHRTI